MQEASYEDIKYYLENIPGVVVINMDGIVTYLNEQCAGYFGKLREEVLGHHILETFPNSKMIEGLALDDPELVFYSSYLGIGITIQVPLFKDGRKVGLLEYDATQSSHRLYELSKGYSNFLDKELLDAEKEIMNFGESKYSINSIIGKSPAVRKLKEEIIAASKSNSTVMITGETGTGKELVAQAIHALSLRRKERIIKINSSAFPENLVESELFGYEEGSFTGAVKNGKKGKFEQADKGTLFIDEVNQMPVSVQPKILRVLQEREVDRIGSERSIPVDVRIIAASNQDLKKLVAEGKFREDLYYRLNVFPIYVPPLRERLEDLELLINMKIRTLNIDLGKSISKVDDSVFEAFRRYDWPGNIRELYNKLEQAMNHVSDDEETLRLEHFSARAGEEEIDIEKLKSFDNPIEEIKKEAERKLISEVLEQFDGNKTRTAECLKIPRSLLYQKMKRLAMDI